MPRERILVIDDSPTLLNLVQLVLTRADFVVTTGEGRPAAVALLEDRPQLVLLGSVLVSVLGGPSSDDVTPIEPAPEGDDELTAFWAALRSDDDLKRVPVIALGLGEGAGAQPRPREIVDGLARPFSPEALLAVVEHVLEARREPNAPATPATDLGSLSLVANDDPTSPGGGREADADADRARAETAALAGDLAIISLADVLGLLDGEAQTGTLSIKRAGARLRFHFAQGRLALGTADGVPEEFLLGRFLVRGGALAAPTLAAALLARDELSAGGPRPLLGTYLVERGLIGAPALQRVLALQTAALVFECLRWGAGRFVFQATRELPAAAREAALAITVPPLLLEGFRRVDEWRLIEREVGDFDGVFVRDDDRVNAFGRARLTREEISVLDLCDGRRSVRELIERSQLGAFDTTKMLYRLSRTRLVRRRVAPVAMPS